jgi:hypothetical protein
MVLPIYELKLSKTFEKWQKRFESGLKFVKVCLHFFHCLTETATHALSVLAQFFLRIQTSKITDNPSFFNALLGLPRLFAQLSILTYV